MNFRLEDLPRRINPDSYKESIELVLERLGKIPAVKSVFQIGGVSSPGISDIDLYVVFHDGSTVHGNPVKGLVGDPGYLFTHNLFGTSESLAVKMEPFTFFGNYKLLYGEPVNMNTPLLTGNDKKVTESQVALEYLAKAYLSISAGLFSGVVKARNILLHAKALLLDLRLLEMEDGVEFETIKSIVDLRPNWFNDEDSPLKLKSLILPYQNSLRDILTKAIAKNRFYLSEGTDMQVARNMILKNDSQVNVKISGIRLPAMINSLSRASYKLHRRFSKHELSLPLTTVNVPAILEERTRLFREAEWHNRQHYPAFLPTAYGLHLFKSIPQ